MDYRKLKNNDELSLLGFGCMRFPTLDGKIDRPKALEMLEYAYNNGVNYFDTAWPYHGGESEPFVGSFLVTKPRDTYKVATKLPIWEIKKEEDVLEIFNKQIENLQSGYIDYYLLHALDQTKWNTIKEFGIIEKCIELKNQGKIRNLGFSFHSDMAMFEQIISGYSWDFCLLQLNYMDTEHQQGLQGYELAKKLDIPVFVMEPIKGGKLVKVSDDITAEFNKVNDDSAAKWALRFVASLDNVKVILSGMSTLEHVKDNIDSLSNFTAMNDVEYAVIAKVKEMINNKTIVGCTSCDYCMPCPAGVNIPRNFSVLNEYAMYQDENGAKWEVKSMVKSNSFADICIECGACEAMCPQNIDIIDKLKVVNETLGRFI